MVVLSARRLFREALARYLERETLFKLYSAPDWASIDAGTALVLIDETVPVTPASANGTPVALLCQRHQPRCKDDRTRLGASLCTPRQAEGSWLVSTLNAFAATGTLADEPRRRRHRSRPDSTGSDLDRLTPRQRHVLELLAEGSRPDGIAAELGISPDTVRAHLHAAMACLGTTSLAETVSRAQHLEPQRSDRAEAPVIIGSARASEPGTAIRLVVANPHALDLAAWSHSLGSMPEFDVVGVATGLRAATEAVVLSRADVVVAHSAVTGPSSRGCATLKTMATPPRVLVVSEAPDERVLRLAVEAGADGYLAGDAPLDELAQAIRRVHCGEPYVPPGMLGELLQHLVRQGREEDAVLSRYVRLTRTERRVLGLLSQGMTLEAIADLLVVSPHTTRTHIQSLLKKLEVHSRVELVALDLRHCLTARFGEPEQETAT